MSHARDDILNNVRSALSRAAGAAAPPPPASARVSARTPGSPQAEIELLLAEIRQLGGKTWQIANQEQLRAALAELVAAESVAKATMWELPALKALGIDAALAGLGVTLVSPHAGRTELASCDLGITGADAAIPETGTLLLCSAPDQPRMVSLVPRVLLAIVRPAALRADLHQALAGAKHAGQFVFITGPSRTADIELTLTIGVHGPGALYVWCLAEGYPQDGERSTASGIPSD